MAYSVSTNFELPADTKIEQLRKELEIFLNCVKGNYANFQKLCFFSLVDGHKLDPTVCDPLDKQTLHAVGFHFINLMLDGKQKINGETNNWSCGFMGSRWCDLNAADFDLDHIRAAFYSKKHYQGEWKYEKPFVIQITCEKAK